jgi:hypothetical protein
VLGKKTAEVMLALFGYVLPSNFKEKMIDKLNVLDG